MLCQILQTDSMAAVQSWLVSAGDRGIDTLFSTSALKKKKLLKGFHNERVLPISNTQYTTTAPFVSDLTSGHALKG